MPKKTKYEIARDSIKLLPTCDVYHERDNEFRFTHQLNSYKITFLPADDTFSISINEYESGHRQLTRIKGTVALLTYVMSL